MNHENARLLLPEWIGAKLDPEVGREVASHVESCDDCRGSSETYRLLVATLRSQAALERNHPAGEAIVDFVVNLRNLDPQRREAVESHLEECADCSRVVAELREAERAFGNTVPFRGSGSSKRILSFRPLATAASVALIGVALYLGMELGRGQSGRGAEGAYGAFELPLITSQARGASAVTEITLAGDQAVLALAVALDLPQGIETGTVRFVLFEASGVDVWEHEVTLVAARGMTGESGVLVLTIPTRELNVPGRYELLSTLDERELLRALLRFDDPPNSGEVGRSKP